MGRTQARQLAAAIVAGGEQPNKLSHTAGNVT